MGKSNAYQVSFKFSKKLRVAKVIALVGAESTFESRVVLTSAEK